MPIVDLTIFDLTGTKYKRSNKQFMVFKLDQVVNFGEAAFAPVADSIALTVTATIDGVSTTLAEGTDYIIPTDATYPDLVDNDAKSRAKVAAKAAVPSTIFDKNLIKGIVVKKYKDVNKDFLISITYQAFYRDPSSFNVPGVGPEYNPTVISAIIDKINAYETTLNTGNSSSSIVSSYLPEDYTGTATTNFIKNELHQIATTNTEFILRPVYGSFYNSSDLKLYHTVYGSKIITATDVGLVIIDNNVEVTLTLANISQYIGKTYVTVSKTLLTHTGATTDDYELIGLNHGKTRVSVSENGVYEYIVIYNISSGYISIDYHAFGGIVSKLDIDNLTSQISYVKQAISGNNILTAYNLTNNATIQGILDRLNVVEHSTGVYPVERLLYPFTTDRTLSIVGNTLYPVERWVDIAKISKGPWDIDKPPKNYIGRFRLTMEPLDEIGSRGATEYTSTRMKPYSFTGSFTLLYDLNTKELSISDVIVSTPTLDKDTEFKFTGSEYVYDNYYNKSVHPKFRIVYNTNTDHGLVLQMCVVSCANYRVKTSTSDQNERDGQYHITMYDLTGPQSAWVLVPEITTLDEEEKVKIQERTDTSTLTTLPDGTIWNWTEDKVNNLKTNSVVVRNKTNILQCEIPVEYIDSTEEGVNSYFKSVELNIPNVNNSLEISSITNFEFVIFDRIDNKYIIAKTTEVDKYINTVEPATEYTDHDVGSIFGSIMFCDDDLSTISCKLLFHNYTYITSKSSITAKMILDANIGTYSKVNKRFVLRQINVLF